MEPLPCIHPIDQVVHRIAAGTCLFFQRFVLARGRYAFVAPAQAPYGTVREFVEHARGRPRR